MSCLFWRALRGEGGEVEVMHVVDIAEVADDKEDGAAVHGRWEVAVPLMVQ